jgi:hypothetical protein
MINTRKTTQDILQEEMLRERAATLARAGERLAEALERLHEMEGEIAARMALWHTAERAENDSAGEVAAGTGAEESGGRLRFLQEPNGKIQAYNRQRENARTRFYYLIVTREALGIIHHQRLEEFYRIPPKQHCLPEEWNYQKRG